MELIRNKHENVILNTEYFYNSPINIAIYSSFKDILLKTLYKIE
jgi:hypothetical protein